MGMALVLSLGTSVFAQDAAKPTGCPEGTWTMMSKELESACKGEMAGKVVTMTGPFTEGDEAKFNSSIAEFEGWTGIDIQYTGSKEFEASIRTAAEANAAPDIADFPQPGLLKDFVKDGKITDVSTFMNPDWLKQNYKQSWLDMAQMAGADGKTIMAGVWTRDFGKDQVWYPKAAWDAAGYKAPTTWDEMLALSDQIVADGATPWCIGIESGAATGWPATDWVEAVMLRTTSLENYDNWSFPADPAKRLPFTSPEVKAAVQKVGDLWFKEGYVNGGREKIVSTSFGDAAKPLFDNPPSCYLHKQGNFIISFFPETVKEGDYDFFYLPPIDPQYGKPYEVSGDIYGIFNDRPEVRAVEDFFSRGESLKAWLQASGTLAAMNDVKPEWYTNAVERKIAQLISEATAVRFDGSDLMPGAVGSGAIFKGMTDWVSGTADLDTVLKEIDAAWPK